jgi:hypothetical protein
VHTTDSVYTTPIYYNGKVDIIRKDDQKKLGTVDAVNGQFSGSINVGEDVAAYAQITFGDITVQSPDYAAGGHTSFSINLSIPCSYRWDEYHPNGLHFTGEQNFGTTIENIPLTKQGNQYSANWNYSENGAQRSGSATLTLQGKQSVMVEFSETISNSSGGFTETLIVSFVASQGIPFSMSVQNYDLFNVSGQVYPYVANYYSKSDNPDRVIETTGVLSNPQYNGSITVFLFY